MQNISKIKLPNDSTEYNISDSNALAYTEIAIGSANAGTFTCELPDQNGRYLVFFYKVNASASDTQGVYMVITYKSTSRIVITPILALGLGMTFSGAHTNGKFVLTLDTGSQTYEYGRVYKLI